MKEGKKVAIIAMLANEGMGIANDNKKHRLLYNFCSMLVLFQAYHQAHLEAIKGFGMHGYEIEFESLVEEYQVPVNAYCFTMPLRV
jgi:hypothetical protein